MEVTNYFGPPLVKLIADPALVEGLNSYSDQIMRKDVLPRSLNYKELLASAVNTEFEVRKGFLPEVEKFLLESGLEYQRRFGKDDLRDLGTLGIESMWIVSQRESEWNYLHSHTGHISGILYLKMPSHPAMNLPEGDKRTKMPGGISFAEGSGGMFHKRIVTVMPAVGELYLFPSTMLHTVYPFFGNEERRAFSFNLNFVKD